MKSSIQVLIAGAACAALAGCGAMQEDFQSAMGGSSPQKSQQEKTQPSQASGSQAPATAASEQLIRRVQEQLQAKGVDAGPADGVWGPQTHEGLQQFQKSQGLEPSGQLNAATLTALGISQQEQQEMQAKTTEGSKSGQSSASASAGASMQNPPKFENLDANNDGEISLAESAADTRVSRDFEKADQDDSGSLSKEEFQAALGMQNQPASAGSGLQPKDQ